MVFQEILYTAKRKNIPDSSIWKNSECLKMDKNVMKGGYVCHLSVSFPISQQMAPL